MADDEKLTQRVNRLDDVVYGHWDYDRHERIPGLIEQSNSMIQEMAERDKQHEALLDSIKTVAWSIARPLLFGVGILILLVLVDSLSHIDTNSLVNILKGVNL